MRKLFYFISPLFFAGSLFGQSAWKVDGNAGINPATEFLGTTDSQPVVFRTFNTEQMRLTSAGDMGLGTLIPTKKLDVNGETRIRILPSGSLTDSLVTADSSGNLRKISFGSFGNGWSLTGNSGTNPSINFLGTTDNQPTVFRTLNTERMRLSASGNLGVGTNNPAAKLDVQGNVEIGTGNMKINSGAGDNFVISTATNAPNPNFQIQIGNGLGGSSHQPIVWNNMLILNGAGNSWCPTCGVPLDAAHRADMVIDMTGNVGIGTVTPTEKLVVNGNVAPGADCGFTLGTSSRRWNTIYSCNGTINTSDEREKTNINDLGYGLKEIQKLRPVTFDWNNDPGEGTKIGLIAQEVQKVIGEVVKTGSDSNQTLGIYYADLIPVLIKGIQEQQESIQSQQTKIEELNAEIIQLKNGNSGLMRKENTSIASADNAVKLYQNKPNPFEQITSISYYIPENIQKATLYIYNLNGLELKSIDINERGKGTIEIDGGELTAGMYIYSLVADGVEADTKHMILTK